MKHVFKYNHLFFTEESKAPSHLNDAFWNSIDNLYRGRPDSDLTVIHDIKYDRYCGRYVEFLEFQCNRESDGKQVEAIYLKRYHFVSLDLSPHLLSEPTLEEIRT